MIERREAEVERREAAVAAREAEVARRPYECPPWEGEQQIERREPPAVVVHHSPVSSREARRKARVKGDVVVISDDGPACPRCGGATQVRAHREITDKQKRKRFYYERWYRCINGACRTKEIIPPEYIVWNEPEPSDDDRRLMAIREQLTPRA